ncbi:MAG: hypothetical protein KDN18_20075 [Verrucomicrobiae bacterium]|nr:hypothetical protein [Verrucomicrobiae bacterium]
MESEILAQQAQQAATAAEAFEAQAQQSALEAAEASKQANELVSQLRVALDEIAVREAEMKTLGSISGPGFKPEIRENKGDAVAKEAQEAIEKARDSISRIKGESLLK